MRRGLAWGMAALAVLIVLTLTTRGDGSASAAVWDENYFPNLPVVTHEGETLNFYDDLIKGKIVVINFIYANCPDLCPLATARMARVQELLGDRVGRDIFMYSITLDPENDTPAALKKHTEAYRIAPGWQFLTGKPKDLALIRHKLGERSRSLNEHRNDVVLGNDRTREWMRTSVFQDFERLANEIRDMDPVWRAQVRSLPTARSYAEAKPARLDRRPGEALFLKACASCHSLGKGDRVGPDLKGVTARRERAWLTRYMMAPDEMLAQQDPVAVDLYARYNGAIMPNLGLSETDVGDLLTYLETQTKRLDAGAKTAGIDHEHKHQDHDHQGSTATAVE